jgi:hypothetical protein
MHSLWEAIARHRAILHLFDQDQLPRTALLIVLLATAFVVLRPRAGTPFAAMAVAIGLLGVQFTGTVLMAAVIATVALLLVLRRGRHEAPTPARTVFWEFGLLVAGQLLYLLGRIMTRASWEDARTNAERLLALEDALGLTIERPVQELVLWNDQLVHLFNSVYSFLYLAVVVGVLFWLFLVDRRNYRLMRNSLGISALLAVGLIALLPVAPPRLMPSSGLIDTVIAVGNREHGFVNEYAAIPSLHVGWMALAGYVLGRSIGGRRGVIVGLIPPLVMTFTVTVTGNHYILDGVIGSAISLAPALALVWRERNSARAARAVEGGGVRMPEGDGVAVLPAVGAAD